MKRTFCILTALFLLLTIFPASVTAETNEGSDKMVHQWIIDAGLTSDASSETLILTSPGNGCAHWGEALEIGGFTDLTMHWLTGTTVLERDQWGEAIILSLKDSTTGDTLELTMHRYRNSSGNYQIHLDVQYINDADGLLINNLVETWSSVTVSGPLTDIRVQLIRNSLREALLFRLYDGDSSASILNVAIQPSLFRAEENTDRFTANILNSKSAVLEIGSSESGAAGWQLTAPTITEPDNTIIQNFFTTDPAWKAQLVDGELVFSTADAVSGWTKHRRPLLTEQPIHFSYQLATQAADVCMELKNASGAASFRFSISKNDGSTLSGTAPDGTSLFEPVSFSASTENFTVDVQIANGVATIVLTGPEGSTLCRAVTTHDFFQSKSLNLIFSSDGNGLCTLSHFRGLPKVITDDLRSLPFTKAVFAGDLVGSWTALLITDIEEYQSCAVKTATTAMDAEEILGANGNLIILAGGFAELNAGIPADAYGATLRTLIEELKQASMLGTVILVTGLPAQSGLDVSAYNAVIRSVAQDTDVLYANLCSALGASSTAVQTDAAANIDTLLAAGEILQELMYHCTCLAVNSATELQVAMMSSPDQTKSALTAFCTADNQEAMKKAVENASLGADLDLYRSLSNASQALVVDALLTSDRSSITSHIQADTLINQIVSSVSAARARKRQAGIPFQTYVAVGDSVSAGEVTANRATDGWVPHFAALVSAAQGCAVSMTNNAISGTRMCTITDNKMFPAAKDTVQDYIAAHDPDLLTIAYGFNDMNAGTSLTDFIETYRIYLTEIREKCPDTVIIICSVYATPGDNNGANIRRWNAALKELAEEFDVIYADTYYDILGSGWLIADGVHPTNAGHRVMASSIFRTLCSNVNLTGEILPPPEETSTAPTTQPDPTIPVTPLPKEKPQSPVLWLGAALLTATATIIWILKRKNKTNHSYSNKKKSKDYESHHKKTP